MNAVPSSGSLTVSIAAERDRHDSILRDGVTPLVRELASSQSLDAVYFKRTNKPEWGIRVRIWGEIPWLEGEARILVEQRIESMAERAVFVNDEAEDKWLGGPREEELLKRIHHLDSLACLELLEIERRAGTGSSRAQWSLLVVEELLNLFGLHGAERLEFYRRGFQWAQDNGRWDAEVLVALEEKFAAQEGALRTAIGMQGPRHAVDAWGGPGPARIAAGLLESAREPVGAALAAPEMRRLGWAPIDIAVFVIHAHSNRIGIHATQEATIRYLVWRASGGGRPQAS